MSEPSRRPGDQVGIAKPWGGRFAEATAKTVERFTASIDVDARLFRHDILGSKAHARMLAAQGLLTGDELAAILTGLDAIAAEIAAGTFPFCTEREDIHMHIEQALTERIGPAGEKLHTGRSRNDQVALDLRLYLREACDQLDELVTGLQRALVRLARRHQDLIMPGYTHLQRAQPVLLAHHLLAYHEMLARDRGRLGDCRRRLDVSPLGAAACAGSGLPLDRRAVAAELGFAAVAANSMDAVADRDFAVELVAAAALIQTHLSRLAEELVLWSSQEFGFITIADAYCTGSSIMPQKKNPDVAELVRGKTGRVVGHLVALFTILKGLPLTYNRDLQEDKEPVFDSHDTVAASLTVLSELLAHVDFHGPRLAAAAASGHSTATDLADYLVRKGMPFRRAHGVVGRAVAHCLAQGKELAELPLGTLQTFAPEIAADVYDVLSLNGSVATKTTLGGTAPAQVEEALRAAEKALGLT
ncbi:MAG: argininosuccinate lyase [Thermodesulfobacteriota bacterium]